MSLRIVDADAHVYENRHTFSYIEPEFAHFTPMQMTQNWGPGFDGARNLQHKEFWLIDKTVYPVYQNIDPKNTTAETRELTNLAARLQHMDELEIDIQVLYPTLFLATKTQNPDWEYHLLRSYNRWLADIWKDSDGRLPWVVLPPLRTMERVRDEIAFAKDNGAVGIMLAGYECERQMDDPYFNPLWEAAQEFDLACCFHSGNHSMAYINMMGISRSGDRFVVNRSPGINAFHVLMMNNIPAKFPKVRWGFIEFSASWLPFILSYEELNKNRGLTGSAKRFDPKTALEENNIWVACQVTDDLNYLVETVGDNRLVIGTDYGHADTAAEIAAMQKIRDEGKISAQAANKILDANARALYGLA